jgi:HSP20 family protein
MESSCFLPGSSLEYLSHRVKKTTIVRKEVIMSNLIRWEPAREMMTLREAMDQLFNEALTRPFALMREGGSTWSLPAIDMYQTDKDVVVKAALPGITASDVEINVAGDMLTIKGEVKQEEEQKNKSWHIREQRWGAFERTIRLPTDVIADRAKADFESGILTVTLPKSKESRPRTIAIKAK